MERDTNGRQTQWKTISMNYGSMEDDLNQRQPQSRTTSTLNKNLMEVDFNGSLTGSR